MTWDRPIRTRRLAPAEVLAGLRDLFTRLTGLPPERAVEFVYPDADVLDLIATDGLDPAAVERYFGTGQLTEGWWKAVVEFGTVDGLCEALARCVEVPAVEPVAVAGRACHSAGAFLLVRRLLADAGADVSGLRPSTPLMPYVWLWPDVFRWQLPRVAPGRVPEVRFLNRRLTRRVLGVVLGLCGMLFGLWLARAFPWAGGLLVAVFLKVIVFDLLLTPMAVRRRNWSVQFGGLYDFRDLASTLADRAAPPLPAAA